MSIAIHRARWGLGSLAQKPPPGVPLELDPTSPFFSDVVMVVPMSEGGGTPRTLYGPKAAYTDQAVAIGSGSPDWAATQSGLSSAFANSSYSYFANRIQWAGASQLTVLGRVHLNLYSGTFLSFFRSTGSDFILGTDNASPMHWRGIIWNSVGSGIGNLGSGVPITTLVPTDVALTSSASGCYLYQRTLGNQMSLISSGGGLGGVMGSGSGSGLVIGSGGSSEFWPGNVYHIIALARQLDVDGLRELADNPYQLVRPVRRRTYGLAVASSSFTATPGVGTLTVTGRQPSVTAGASVTPGAGSLTITGRQPTVTTGSGLNVTPGTGTLTLTGYAPSVFNAVLYTADSTTRTADTTLVTADSVTASIAVNVTPGTGTLAFTGAGVAGSDDAGFFVGMPGAESGVSSSGSAPSVTAGASIVPGVGTLTLTGRAPTVAAAATVTPGTGALTITGYTPVFAASTSVTPGVGALTVTGRQPIVTAAASVTPGAGSLTITGRQPTVTTGAGLNVIPSTGTLALAGPAPTVAAAATVTPGVGTITFTGYAPTVSVAASVSVTPGVGTLIIAGRQSTIAAGASVTAGTGALTIAGRQPTVTTGAGVNVTPNTGTLTFSGYAPQVSTGAAIVPNTGHVVFTGHTPAVSNADIVAPTFFDARRVVTFPVDSRTVTLPGS